MSSQRSTAELSEGGGPKAYPGSPHYTNADGVVFRSLDSGLWPPWAVDVAQRLGHGPWSSPDSSAQRERKPATTVRREMV